MAPPPPSGEPNARSPAAADVRIGAPVVATFRAASVEGGVAPWSMDETSSASMSRPTDGEGTSPLSSK